MPLNRGVGNESQVTVEQGPANPVPILREARRAYRVLDFPRPGTESVWLASTSWSGSSSIATASIGYWLAATEVGLRAKPVAEPFSMKALGGGYSPSLLVQSNTRYRLPGVVHAIGALAGRRDAGVVTMHDMRPFHRRRRPWDIQRGVFRTSCLRAKVITTYNEVMRAELTAALGQEVGERTVAIPLPHGEGHPFDRPSPDFDILWVGRAEKRKRLPLFLKTLRDVPLGRSVAILWSPVDPRLGGEVVDIDALVRIEAARGRRIVAMRSGIDAAELDRLYRVSRLLVSTSTYEGFHAPPMEAYLRGTRLVLPRLEVYRESYGGAAGIEWYDGLESLAPAIESALSGDRFNPAPSVVDSVSMKTIGNQLRAVYQVASRR